MTVEDPLSWIVRVGAGETIRVSFVGDLGPVGKVKGDLDQRGVCNIEFLVYAPYR